MSMTTYKEVLSPPNGELVVNHAQLKDLIVRLYEMLDEGIYTNSLMVIGPTGVGKSQVIIEASKELAERYGREFVYGDTSKSNEAFVLDIQHLSRVTPDQIAGAPWPIPDKKILVKCIPEHLWYFSKNYERETGEEVRGVLFLDEFGQALDENIYNAIQQLLIDRKLEGIELADGVLVVCASNMWCAGNYTDVTDIQDNILARIKRVYLPPADIEEWRYYAMPRGVHWTIIAFLELNPDLIWCKSGNWIATPRGWESAGKEITFYEENYGLDEREFANIVAMHCGTAIAKNYEQFLKVAVHLSLDEVLENPGLALDQNQDIKISIAYNACAVAKRDPSKLPQVLKLVLTFLYGTDDVSRWLLVADTLEKTSEKKAVMNAICKASTKKASADLAVAMINILQDLLGKEKLKKSIDALGKLRNPLLYVRALGGKI